MKVKSFTFNPLMENSYVIYDETKSCAIIDPGCCCSAEEDELKAFVEKEGLKPVLLLNTHLHFDHIWGNPMVMKEYGLKPKANVADKVFLDGGQLQFHGLPEDLNSLRFDVRQTDFRQYDIERASDSRTLARFCLLLLQRGRRAVLGRHTVPHVGRQVGLPRRQPRVASGFNLCEAFLAAG